MSKDKDKDNEKDEAAKAPAKSAGLLKMVRSEELAKGGPTSADVHPEEEAGYAAGGWVRAQAEAKK